MYFFLCLLFQRFTIAKVAKAHKLVVTARQRQKRKSALHQLNQTIKTSPIRKPKFRKQLCKSRTVAMLTDCNINDTNGRKLQRYKNVDLFYSSNLKEYKTFYPKTSIF